MRKGELLNWVAAVRDRY